MSNFTRILMGLTCALALAACGAAPAALTPNIDATVQVDNVPPNPDLAMDYFNRAFGYTQSGDWQLAIRDYTKAIELGIPTTHRSGQNPLATAYAARGAAYNQLGQDQRVIDIAAATWTAQVVSDWDTYWASKEPS